MLLANYASDSGSDSESETQAQAQPLAGPSRPATSTANTTTTTTTASSKVKRKGPIKITLDLPKPERSRDTDVSDDEAGSAKPLSDDESERASKKPKLGGVKGKGSSALLGMLPPPKRKLPGGSTNTKSSLAVNKSMASKPPTSAPPPPGMPNLAGITAADGDDEDDLDNDSAGGGGAMAGLLPASIARNKAKSKAAAPLDLFGLSEPSSTPLPAKSKTPSLPPSISSAPAVADFVPPEPTSTDPYPGYYQLPSGQWQAYDPEYYHSFFADTAEPTKEKGDDGRVGHHWDEFDTKGANVLDIDVKAGLEAARKEAEIKALQMKPKVTGDGYEYKPIGQIKGVAAQRHQLTSLLNTAFTQREELEDRIAQNKKNMRMAGQKYGF